MKLNKSLLSAALLVGFLPLAADASSQTWSTTAADGVFTTGANWDGLAAPGASGSTASADVATFGASTTTTLTVGDGTGTYSLGQLSFSANNPAYSFSGDTLRLNTGIAIAAPTSAVGGNITIANNLLMLSAGMTISNAPNNVAASGFTSGALTLSGNINLDNSATANRTLTLTANRGNLSGYIAPINVTGNISEGTSGFKISLNNNGSGILTISGNNSYSGTSTLSGGVTKVGHNSALGTGNISFGNGGLVVDGLTARTLTNTWSTTNTAGLVFGFSNVTLIDPSNTGTLTLQGNGTLNLAAAGQKGVTVQANTILNGVISEGGGFKTGLTITGSTLGGNGTKLTVFWDYFRCRSFDVAKAPSPAAVWS